MKAIFIPNVIQKLAFGAAPDAQHLMRSRYSAYACTLPDYIIRTTHPQSRHYRSNKEAWIKDIRYFCEHTRFVKLEVRKASTTLSGNPKKALVQFIAYLQQNGKDLSLSENSLFEKVDGQWLYIEDFGTVK